MLTMERPAPERWIPDGGSDTMTEQPSTHASQDDADERPRLGDFRFDTTGAAFQRLTAPTLRTYLQAIIDDTGWSVKEIDAYADKLAEGLDQQHPLDPVTRAAAEIGMVSFIAGYEVGHNSGYGMGRREGHWEERRGIPFN